MSFLAHTHLNPSCSFVGWGGMGVIILYKSILAHTHLNPSCSFVGLGGIGVIVHYLLSHTHLNPSFVLNLR